MITQRDLVQYLVRRDPGTWSVVERIQDIAFASEQPPRQRRDHRTRLTLIVHHDVPRGRGTARLDIDPFDGSVADLVDQASSLALAAVGPAWASTPPAAPAKVDLVDPDLVKRELDAVALGTLARFHHPDRATATTAAATATVTATATATAEVLRERVTVIASSGFHASWLATALRADAVLSTGDHSLTVSRHARRGDDLDLDAALAAAHDDLRLLTAAGPPSPGPCALWLGPEALIPGLGSGPGTGPGSAAGRGISAGPDLDLGGGGGRSLSDGPRLASDDRTTLVRNDRSGNLDDYGVWTVFAQQADSAVERQGLTRYRLHADIAHGASQLAEPLSIASDGALDFATLSLPVTDDAVAIRRFPLIDRGVAVGLGLSPREAAFRRTDPNGGVRNLVIAPGTWSPSPSPTARTLEIRRLHALAIDPYTGEATLDIALGLDHRPGRSTPTPFTGGTLHLDLVTTLARARRSSQLIRRSAYHGPACIFIDDVELIV